MSWGLLPKFLDTTAPKWLIPQIFVHLFRSHHQEGLNIASDLFSRSTYRRTGDWYYPPSGRQTQHGKNRPAQYIFVSPSLRKHERNSEKDSHDWRWRSQRCKTPWHTQGDGASSQAVLLVVGQLSLTCSSRSKHHHQYCEEEHGCPHLVSDGTLGPPELHLLVLLCRNLKLLLLTSRKK
jgi:hypothetical protein